MSALTGLEQDLLDQLRLSVQRETATRPDIASRVDDIDASKRLFVGTSVNHAAKCSLC